MKRLLTIVCSCALALLALPVMAQSQAGEVIVLDDTTPSISATIGLPQNATGVVSLNLNNAAVTVTDSSGSLVFQAADARIHTIELSIIPNAGAQTITVQRLPGTTQGAVTIAALPELTSTGLAPLVDTLSIVPNQQHALTLNAANPGGNVQFSIPNQTTGIVTSTYYGANLTSQLMDTKGAVVATAYGSAIDGLNVVLDSGAYSMTFVGSNLTNTVTAGVQLMPTETSGLALLQLPALTEAPVVVAETTTIPAQTVSCDATIIGTSVNLRSGPGTGYNVLGYGYYNEQYPVGGINPEQNWVVIGLPNGSAWVSKNLVNLSGSCDTLTVFNVPFLDAPEAQIVFQPGNGGSTGSVSSSSGFNGEHEEHEHEEHEEHGEHEGDDD